MIDEQRTLEIYGYTSDSLAPHSHKPIVAVCEECGTYRVVQKRSYRYLCHPCANQTPEHLRNLSESHKGYVHTEESKHMLSNTLSNLSPERKAEMRHNQSQAEMNRPPERKAEISHKMSIAKQGNTNNKGKTASEETRMKMSCTRQGCTIEEWDGFAVDSPYCPKFNEACKERNREKYDRRCFICNKTEAENGRKLSVHHVDMNKQQGCDSVWQLVPLCARHHGKAHNETVQARLEYLLKHVWVI